MGNTELLEQKPPSRHSNSPGGVLLPFGKWLAIAVALTFYLWTAKKTVREEGYWDFILQWTLVRLAVTADGDKIYDYPTQRALLAEALVNNDLQFLERPHIKDVGVSPYPPMMVVLYYPLGFLSLAAAQQCMVYLSVVLAVVSAWAIARSVEGRISFGTALAAILYYPGFLITASLGQSAMLLLAFLSLGWWALSRRRDVLGGVFWGLLIYKIPWVVAVGWLPLVLGRPRAYLGMAASVLGLACIATAAFGVEVWAPWLHAAKVIGQSYHEPGYVQEILGKACDLRGAVARYAPTAIEKPLSWLALATVGGVSLAQYWFTRRAARDRQPDAIAAPTACPLLFAAALISPYLFHYDVSAFLLPVLVLWSHHATMTSGQRRLLVVLTAAFYLALPTMDQWEVDWLLGFKSAALDFVGLSGVGLPRLWEPWKGPPLATFVNLGLWLFSIWFSHRWAVRSETNRP